jgi:hypothetical protein
MGESLDDVIAISRMRKQEAAVRRDARLAKVGAEIKAVEDAGFTVKKCTEYHYQINGVLNFYPSWRNYHHSMTGRKGKVKPGRLLAFVKSVFGEQL